MNPKVHKVTVKLESDFFEVLEWLRIWVDGETEADSLPNPLLLKFSELEMREIESEFPLSSDFRASFDSIRRKISPNGLWWWDYDDLNDRPDFVENYKLFKTDLEQSPISVYFINLTDAVLFKMAGF